MLGLLATFGFTVSRRLAQVGDLLCLIGALVLVGAACRSFRRWGLLIGGLVLAAGFVLLLVSLHWGVNPYRRTP
jgi:hypothetical protein